MRNFRSEMGQSENHHCQMCDFGGDMLAEIDRLRQTNKLQQDMIDRLMFPPSVLADKEHG